MADAVPVARATRQGILFDFGGTLDADGLTWKDRFFRLFRAEGCSLAPAAFGVPVSLLTATVIEAFGMAIRVATFLIPGNIGALEGGYAATFAALGLGATTGVTFSLVRRIREITWITLGLLLFAMMRRADAPRGAG